MNFSEKRLTLRYKQNPKVMKKYTISSKPYIPTSTIKRKLFFSKKEVDENLKVLVSWCKKTGRKFTTEEVNGFPENWNSFIYKRVTVTEDNGFKTYCCFLLPVCFHPKYGSRN